jgi:threonine-phosphate decarboxylase
LLDNYGILIRDASNIQGLDNNYFRVTAQQPEENDLLVEAITAYVEHLNEVSD